MRHEFKYGGGDKFVNGGGVDAGAITHCTHSLVDLRTVAPFSLVVVAVPMEDRSTSLY